MQVFGTKGYARTFPTELYCNLSGEWGKYKPVMPPRVQQCDLPMYEAQMDRFTDCVLGKKKPEPDAEQGRKSVVLLEAVYESIPSGTSVAVSNH